VILKWVRTWPKTIPPNRSYIVDDCQKVEVEKYDSSPLADVQADGIFLLEWDMAISPEDAEYFESICRKSQKEIKVAPYYLYSTHDSHWCHWNCDNLGVLFDPRNLREDGFPRDLPLRYVKNLEPDCDGFGFGCVYFPMRLLQDYVEAGVGKLTDLNFSIWNLRRGTNPIEIVWDVRPAHLHFSWSRRPFHLVSQSAMEDDLSSGQKAMQDDAQIPILAQTAEILPLRERESALPDWQPS
jgi:hypothetical protein